MRIENSVAIITGGASGLGEATVILLSSLGAKIVIADINETLGNQLVQTIGNKNVIFIKTDISNEDSCKNLIEKTVEIFGEIHIVLNSGGVLSAGIIATSKKIASSEEFLRVLKINVIGTFNVSKYAAKQFISQKAVNEDNEKGIIINVASVAGIEGQIGQTIYSGSKGAIIGMTLPMARDLGRHGIRVVTIAPGVFETPMGKGIPDKFIQNIKKETPLGVLGQPRQFADSVVAVINSSFISGTTIRVDGGIRLPKF